jgi:hypothetical protein
MLEEPPLIVRMRRLDGFMDSSLIILRSDQLRRRPTPEKIAALRTPNDHRGSLRLAGAEPACIRDLPGCTLQ